MSARRKLVHVERIAIRWGDMDAMGHVNNPAYFRYMEQARTVEVQVYAGAPGGSSVPTYYELKIGGELYADGAATVVFIDMARQTPVRIPQTIRELLQ